MFLKNILTDCCTRVIELELEKINVSAESKKLGHFQISFDAVQISFEDIIDKLKSLGFEPVNKREEKLVEQIKAAIINLVHYSTYNAMVRNSDFLVGRFGISYQHMSSIFSKYEKITLEKYIILQKIEKVKELIEYDELSLSEIAYMMGYSSVQYLSTQFKSVSGQSVTEFKKNPTARKNINRLQE